MRDVVWVLAAWIAVQGSFTSAEAQTASQLATLEGKVVEAATQTPVRKASVSLMVESGELVSVTDEAGVFRFADLKGADYRLSVEKTGFLLSGYGVTKPNEQGRLLTVKNGEHRSDLLLQLFPAATLSGRVVDAEGDPLVNRTVMLWKKHARGKIGQQDEASTNQAGEYRFASVLPGTYFVSAEQERYPSDRKTFVDGDGRPTKLQELKTFFPEAEAIADAQGVTVDAGQEMSGIEVHVRRGVAPSIKGRIVGMSGAASRYRLNAFMGEQGPAYPATISQNGEFVIDSVPQGIANISLSESGPNDSMKQVGKTDVLVGEQNVTGVFVHVQRPARVRVRIISESGEQLHTSGRVLLICKGDERCLNAVSEVSEDSYIFNDVIPGQYLVDAQEMFGHFYLKSVQVNGKIADRSAVDIGDGAVVDVLATYSNHLGRVSGEIDITDLVKSSSVRVFMIPQDRSSVNYVSELNLGETLHFKDDAVRPDKYLIFAAEETDLDFWSDPAAIALLKNSGTECDVSETSNLQLHLKVIPKPDIDVVRQRLGY